MKFIDTVYVNAYLTNRAYGGPEEGGWWYDTGELLDTKPLTLTHPVGSDEDEVITHRDLNIDDAHAVALIEIALWEKHEHLHDERHEVGSVICDGRLELSLDTGPGASYPQDRPHYE